jgi:hypothetical protein
MMTISDAIRYLDSARRFNQSGISKDFLVDLIQLLEKVMYKERPQYTLVEKECMIWATDKWSRVQIEELLKKEGFVYSIAPTTMGEPGFVLRNLEEYCMFLGILQDN